MKTVKAMMQAAPLTPKCRVSLEKARELIAQKKALFVNVRDAPEVEKTGKIAGSLHVLRGMLEFRADRLISINSSTKIVRWSCIARQAGARL